MTPVRERWFGRASRATLPHGRTDHRSYFGLRAMRAGREVRQVWAFIALLALSAVALYGGQIAGAARGSAPVDVPWPVIAVGFFLAEIKVVDVHFRREKHSFSLSEFPAVIGLFFLSPPDYLLAVLAGSAAGAARRSRQPADQGRLQPEPTSRSSGRRP